MLSRTISEVCGLQDQSKGEVVNIVSTEASASSAESSGTSMALQHCPKLRLGLYTLTSTHHWIQAAPREGRYSLDERAVFIQKQHLQRGTQLRTVSSQYFQQLGEMVFQF